MALGDVRFSGPLRIAFQFFLRGFEVLITSGKGAYGTGIMEL
jgi:hypothetical protein